jgi:hypothetical protein
MYVEYSSIEEELEYLEKELPYLAYKLIDETVDKKCRMDGKRLILERAVACLEKYGTKEAIENYKEYLINVIIKLLQRSYGRPVCFPRDELKQESLGGLVYLYRSISRAILEADQSEGYLLSSLEPILSTYEKLNESKKPECRYLDQISYL